MVRLAKKVGLAALAWLSSLAGCALEDCGTELRPQRAATTSPSATASAPAPALGCGGQATSSGGKSSLSPLASAWPPPDPGYRAWGDQASWPGTLAEQNEVLFEQLVAVHELDAEQMDAIRRVFRGSEYLGQGNPEVTVHPATVSQCLERVRPRAKAYRLAAFERHCGARFMAPLYDPETQTPEQAQACIDQLEFPNIPCAYPVTWVRASEAAALCRAMGKRLCDAHEWEGACAGRLEPPDYDFEAVRNASPEDAVILMRSAHNSRLLGRERWAYGPAYRPGICGTSSQKSKRCTTIGWSRCGTNSFPSGTSPTAAARSASTTSTATSPST